VAEADVCFGCDEYLHKDCSAGEDEDGFAQCTKCRATNDIAKAAERHKQHLAHNQKKKKPGAQRQPASSPQSATEAADNEDDDGPPDDVEEASGDDEDAEGVADELACLEEDEPPLGSQNGVVGRKIYIDRNGAPFAFIEPDNTALAATFVHQSQAAVPLEPGTRVTFITVRNPRKPAEMRAVGVQAAPPDFQHGENRSVLAEMITGADFMAMPISPPHPIMREAVEAATTTSRMRLGHLAQQEILKDPRLQQQTMAMACSLAIHRLRHRLRWSWSTIEGMGGTLASFLARADLYCPARPVLLGKEGSWKETMRAIHKHKNMAKVKQALPLDSNTVDKILAPLLADPAKHGAAFCLIIGWAHAARVLNITTLLPHNFLNLNQSIRWDKAKTTAIRGKYTTTSVYGGHTKFVQEYLMKLPPGQCVCTTSDAATMRKAIVAVNKEYDLRSLRRGALQQLAASGVKWETLLLFSGHTTKKSLLRYLGWGEKYMADVQAGILAGRTLWQMNLTQ
jgi:hypothetical protein